MNNYVFECASGKYGFFRMDLANDRYYILMNTGIFDDLELSVGILSRRQDYESRSPDSLEWLKNTDPTERLLSIILWHESIQNREIKRIVPNTNPGKFYKRSIRGIYYNTEKCTTEIYNQSAKLDEIRSFHSICNSLTSLFDFIEPEHQNLTAYGNKIREGLILGCTEVEYLLKKTLIDNNYTNSARMSMNDYVKTLPYLKLEQYSVKLKMFPDLGSFRPFANWSSSQPTQSLNWYESYNAVKHDRGSNKNRSTLEMLINSVAAIHIILEAHYGEHLFDSPMRSSYESIFQTETRPTWSLHELPMPMLGSDQPWDGALQVTF
ncbi:MULTISPECIES: hypothetical protein [Citrobacter freundii complex]|uniref:hypothetical protein n=1 Tax=Citrobacter freundii complex TaxID=1344959 RepID=UPI00226BB1A0|nr:MULTISPECIES: hypothetical protein [Citrobacter freundii complex]MCX8968624.1 hypothetical protein [Citrobacter portucalensis]MCX9036458.1 hypothetical protein [Citrobacter portucalensis]MDT9377480.1 hypothetical protein [Citrobacter freundii]